MLVLSRQKNETIMIGDDVEITIVDIKGDKVRLGITAPRSIAVHRKEVYLAIKEENLRAQQLAATVDLGRLGALFGSPPTGGPPRPGPDAPAAGAGPAAGAPRPPDPKDRGA